MLFCAEIYLSVEHVLKDDMFVDLVFAGLGRANGCVERGSYPKGFC